mmetsp:Transcript_50642/g.80684  ORF Transcript_50642/g.80684 Transcript_50642/m.80684 type:complete len:215 (+) Transcript_50642:149-793(+)
MAVIHVLLAVTAYVASAADFACRYAIDNGDAQPLGVCLATYSYTSSGGTTIEYKSSSQYVCTDDQSQVEKRSYDTVDCTGEYSVDSTVTDTDDFDCVSSGCPIMEYRGYTTLIADDGTCSKSDDYSEGVMIVNQCINVIVQHWKFTCDSTNLYKQTYGWNDWYCNQTNPDPVTYYETGCDDSENVYYEIVACSQAYTVTLFISVFSVFIVSMFL